MWQYVVRLRSVRCSMRLHLKVQSAAVRPLPGGGGIVEGAAMPPSFLRQAEFDKYKKAYQSKYYGMGRARMKAATELLKDLSGSYLDVGCGRGEMLRVAEDIGLDPVTGVEVVSDLIGGKVMRGEAHALPFDDNSFDHVSMFDVIEHLLPGDDYAACKELQRVARKSVLLTVADFPHIFQGTDLHINRRRYTEWDELFTQWFDGHVEWLTNRGSISETWVVSLN